MSQKSFTPRSATRFLAANAARYGHKAVVTHKRDESHVSVTPSKRDELLKVFTRAIEPALAALDGVGKVGINVIGMGREEIAEMIAAIDPKKWKWAVFEKGNVLILPRDESPLSEDHITTVAQAAPKSARVGFGALVRA